MSVTFDPHVASGGEHREHDRACETGGRQPASFALT